MNIKLFTIEPWMGTIGPINVMLLQKIQFCVFSLSFILNLLMREHKRFNHPFLFALITIFIANITVTTKQFVFQYKFYC